MVSEAAGAIDNLGSLIPYWAFMLVTAGGFYKATVFVGGHFPEDFRKDLSLWLDGVYDTSWSTHFCRMFDAVFGARHLSVKRFVRSAIASVLSVFGLYILFAHVLGVMGSRTFGAIPVTQALLVGAVINIIPDYLSLIETRWLLQRFGRYTSFAAHVGLLIADLIFSAAIVTAWIYGYVWFAGERIPSPVELVALFSVYSVFFYSTFMTSAWAWVYCISAWFVRLFSRVGLRKVLDVKKDPVKQIALVGAAVMVLGGTMAGPVLWPKEGGFSNSFDDLVCSLDRRACFHAGRIAEDIERATHFMIAACGDTSGNVDCTKRIDSTFSEIEQQEMNRVVGLACNSGNAEACNAYGFTFENGIGVDRDPIRAAGLYRQACDSGLMIGCYGLGTLYEVGKGVELDLARAAALYRRACDGGYEESCSGLGYLFDNGFGSVDADPALAAALFQQACDRGSMLGCNNLGAAYENGRGVDRDPAHAAALYLQACDGGNMLSCANLGWMYESGNGVDSDPARAVALYLMACEGGNMDSCGSLGQMYRNGMGVEIDLGRASTLFQKACEGDNMLGCNDLGWMYQNGYGVDADPARAVALYLQACDGGIMGGCGNLGWMYQNGVGTAADPVRAFASYRRACDGANMPACADLGKMYEYGVGVGADPARANALYSEACDGGWTEACSWTIDPPQDNVVIPNDAP